MPDAAPIRTSVVWAKSTPGLRAISARIGIAASSSARTVLSEPFIARPMGVRMASTITASGIAAPPRVSATYRSETEPPHAFLVPAEVVGELVAHGPCHLGFELLGIMSEVAQQRVAEDHNPVVEEVAGDRIALVEAVGATTPSPVGDDDRDVLERAMELERQLVDGGADERTEVLLVVQIDQVLVLVVLAAKLLVGLPREAFGREALGVQHQRLEVLLGLWVAPAGDVHQREHGRPGDNHQASSEHRDPLNQSHGKAVAEAGDQAAHAEAHGQRREGAEHDPPQGRRLPRHRYLRLRAITSRWIS